jgi:hypothetical protein
MTSTFQWLKKHKGLIVYGTVLALSMALTACAKGFRVEVNEKPVQKGTIALIQSNLANSKSLEAIAAAYNQEAAAYLKARPANSIADIKAQAILTLRNLSFSNPQLLGRDSTMTLQLQLKTDQRTINVLVQSTSAILALGSDGPLLSESGALIRQGTGNVTISGYWTLDAKDQWGNPMLIGLNSQVQQAADGQLTVTGELIANVDRSTNPQQLATFQNINLCSLTTDTAWTWDAFEQGGVDCPVDPAP